MILSRRKFLTLTGTLAAGSAVLPELAFATPISISSLPTTISSPGSYVLTANHNLNLASGAAITVVASDVSIDLQGYTISNSSAGVGTSAVGVYAINRRVKVRNGTIEGFHTGTFLQGGQLGGGCIVEDMSLVDCTAAAIMLTGASSIIRRNIISSSLRTTQFCSASATTGILGIGLANASHSRITDNTFTFTDLGTSDFVVAIYSGANSDELAILDNNITGTDWGIVVDEFAKATADIRNTSVTSVAHKAAGGVDLDLL